MTSQTPAPSPHAPLSGRARRSRLLTTVALSTLAAVVVFSLFYVIGAVVALGAIALAGVALIAALAWLSLKPRRRAVAIRAASPPVPRP